MVQSGIPVAPSACLTLRAHHPAPARVELVYRPASRRLARTLFWIVACWGSIPLLLWVPPHYPWVAGAFVAGAYLAYRDWTGRYSVHSFAGICPRCGSPLSLGLDRKIDLPHTLTCFSCHFEPRLEVSFAGEGEGQVVRLEHQVPECVGLWKKRWLADSAFLYCEECHGGLPWSDVAKEQAEAENERAEILARLTDEGQPFI
ncbi:MAG: hypothetical protein GEU90_04330 [Gemmatimonas sp.]|nr:hypothetical protein [Gemmatimonas sp.]